MSVLNVEEWTSKHVSDWMSGLDESIRGYATNFLIYNVDGKRLLNLMCGELVHFGVYKIGDQLLLYDGITRLREELESDRVTLQSLALNLKVRCSNYRSELSAKSSRSISTKSLSTASYALDSAISTLRWLTRYPFLGYPAYSDFTKSLTKHSFELAMASQRDSFADNAIEEVQYLCTSIIAICEKVISLKDLLIFQPACIDVITLRRRIEEDLGIQFETTHYNLHMISGVTLNSPAQQSMHLERGDEILQINYQTCISWTQAAIINLLAENKEIILTVKRRPRDGSKSAQNIYLLIQPNKMPMRKNITVSPIKEAEAIKVTKEEDQVDSKASNNNATSAAAESRFWTMYPRTSNLIRRRKSISGSSPTEGRPPCTFFDEDNAASAANSGTGKRKNKPPLDKAKSIQVELSDEILKVFGGDLNKKGSRVTLPSLSSISTSSDSPNEPEPTLKTTPNLNESPCVVSDLPNLISEPYKDDSPPPPPLPKKRTLPPTPQTLSQPIPEATNRSSSNSKNLEQHPYVPSKEITHSIIREIGGGEEKELTGLEHSGYLHFRQSLKAAGCRWVPFHCSVDKKYLKIRIKPFETRELELSKLKNVGVAREIHSRPYAFKFEYANENVPYYYAAESLIEFNIWMRILTNDKSYCRSFSEDKSRSLDSEIKSRRSSLPQTEPRSKKTFSRSLYQSKSLSMGKLPDVKRPGSGGSYGGGAGVFSENNTPTSSRSNISSISITSLKRVSSGSGGSSGQYSPMIANSSHSSSAQDKDAARRAFFKSKKIEPSGDSAPTLPGRKYPPLNLTPSRNRPHSNFNGTKYPSNSGGCEKCGKRNPELCDSSTQTDSVVILLDNYESVV